MHLPKYIYRIPSSRGAFTFPFAINEHHSRHTMKYTSRRNEASVLSDLILPNTICFLISKHKVSRTTNKLKIHAKDDSKGKGDRDLEIMCEKKSIHRPYRKVSNLTWHNYIYIYISDQKRWYYSETPSTPISQPKKYMKLWKEYWYDSKGGDYWKNRMKYSLTRLILQAPSKIKAKKRIYKT